jgi:DNA topoisomerase-1
LSSAKNPRQAIIVESPAKTKTLAHFLGKSYKLLATKGHVRDLPEHALGVDVENGFQPTYVVIPGQKKHLSELRKQLAGMERIFLACDPDREGEAIAWHVTEALQLPPERVARVEFNEITPRAVREALQHPRPINLQRVHAQQARRVLDRLVGYLVSPLLQRRLGGGRHENGQALSAGRVQSAALRLIVERERERAAFVPTEYWRVRALLRPEDRDERFEAELVEHAGEKVHIANAAQAEQICAALRAASFVVAAVEKSEARERPQPPFRTSTLQQAAASRLGWQARRTMRVAQELYEGVDLPEGTVGLITYMRTDSTRIAPEARAQAVQFVTTHFGPDYVGPGARGRPAKGAQEAHEAIRPTAVERTPDALAPYLTPDQLRLYRLIWQRFVASQMAPAVYEQTRVEVEAGPYLLRALGRVLQFPGWRTVYGEPEGEPAPPSEVEGAPGEQAAGGEAGSAEHGAEGGGLAPAQQQRLPQLFPGQALVLVELRPSQHFTEPPPRFTEGSLVAEMERHGIGRPSTYAPIIDTLRQRKYVRMQGRALVPTPLGMAVFDYLDDFFGQIVDLQFTARMEERLDEIEQGRADWVSVLAEFYQQLAQWLAAAESAPPQVLEGEHCPRCGARLVKRFSRRGRFASCERFPACDYARDLGWRLEEHCPQCGQPLEVVLTRGGSLRVQCSNEQCGYVREPAAAQGGAGAGGPQPPEEPKSCPTCGAPLVVRSSGRRQFRGCSRFPACRYTEPLQAARRQPALPTDLDCPQCGARLVVRRGRYGAFLGCSNFPQCAFTRKLTAAEKERYLSASRSAPGEGEQAAVPAPASPTIPKQEGEATD